MAPTMVAPDRDTPGISASAWHDADPERARERRVIGVLHVGAAGTARR